MMRAGRSIAALFSLGVVFLILTLPALAQELPEPAVTIPVDNATAPLPDWTYRFMIPATLVLAAVVILITSIRYFTNVVRRRYRIVEE